MPNPTQIPEIPEAPPMPDRPETNPKIPEITPQPTQPVTVPGPQPIPSDPPTRIPPKEGMTAREILSYVRMICDHDQYAGMQRSMGMQ